MDLQIPPHAAAEHRGSYSSIRSAAGIWTPPHSPHSPSTDIHMDTEPMGPAVYPSGQHGGYEGYKSAEGHESLKGLKGVEGPRAHEDLEDPNTPHVNPIKVENMADAMNQEPARHESPDILEGNANHHDHSGQPAQVEEQPTELRLSDFEVVDTLGTGTFGRVLLVRLRPPPQHANAQDQDQAPAQHFAMKVLKKTDVVRLRQVEHVNAERFILARIRHPFIVDLYATFQDNLNIYMLLSYVPGGELFSHLRRAGRFSADVTRFYLAIIVLALRYLHSYNIIYRDLKPENLLLDHRGYLRITDFGFAKVVDDRTWTLCGTPEYLAPEIIQSDGHGKAVDWWACGILCYEMLVGYPPFYDDNAFGIYEKILQGKINWPQHVDPLSRDLIRAFLHPDRSKRLGNLIGGTDDVLLHPWFRGVDWGMLERCEIRAPILPQVTSSGDTRNFSRLPMVNASDIPGLAGEPVPHNTQDIYAAQFADF